MPSDPEKDRLMTEIGLMREQIKSHLESLNTLENIVIVATGALWSFYAGFGEKNAVIVLILYTLAITTLGVGYVRFLGLSGNIYLIDEYTKSVEDIAFESHKGWATIYRDSIFREKAYKYMQDHPSDFSIPVWQIKSTSMGRSRMLFWKAFFAVDTGLMIVALLAVCKFR